MIFANSLKNDYITNCLW